MKTSTEANKDLLDVHKQMKDLEKDDAQKRVTNNNAFFVGSTKELQDLVNKQLPSSRVKRLNQMSKIDNTAYLGNPNLKAANVDTEFTKEQIEEYARCAADPMYFIENFVKIVSLDEGLIQFQPYGYQKKMINSIHNDRFVIAKLPRQSGKSTIVIAHLLHYVLLILK